MRRSANTRQIISIQSQVVHGHVGNSAAAWPMQALGATVAVVPTTLLSNHPHYPTVRGRVLEADLVADLLRGVEERGLVEDCAVLLTGYLGSVEVGEVVSAFVERALRRNPDILCVCDPVIGDDGIGVFVAYGLPELIRDRLLPQARLATPNQFELEWLAKRPARDLEGLIAAIREVRGGRSIDFAVTGCILEDTPDGQVETIVAEGDAVARIAAPRIPIRPCGTGDLFTGVLVAHRSAGLSLCASARLAVQAVSAILTQTQIRKSEEMIITLDALGAKGGAGAKGRA